MKKIINKIYKKSASDYYKELFKWLKNNKRTFIITANPETIMYSKKDTDINNMLNDKNVSIVPDGIGIVKAAKILNIEIKERIPGIDIANKLLEYCDELGKSLYLFGSTEEVITSMKKIIKEKYPNIDLIGATNGYIKDKDKIMQKIANKEPDVVMVALGIPHQEKLIYKHLNEFKKGILIGVGGSFDVISGIKKRAPKIFINTNTEWLYRIVCEPKRIKRFWNNNVKFLFQVKKINNEK